MISCNNTDKNIIASIDGVVIETDLYLTKLLEFRKKHNLPDNGQVRRDLLKKLIDEKMFIFEAKQLGLDKDSIALFEKEKNYIQKTLDMFVEQNILKNLSVSDEELKKYFILTSTRVRASHLYAQTRRQADSLYNLVNSGYKFEDIAKTVFKDPQLKESGGDLGYFTYNEMDLDFADHAFSMKIGEISKPVKTNDGYSIIKVEDRVGNPLFTETEFLKKKNKLFTDYRIRKKKILAKGFVDSVSNQLQINFDTKGLNTVFQKIRNIGTLTNRIEPNRREAFTKDELSMRLLSRGDVEWTIGAFLDKARFTSMAQQKWIRNMENLEDFIKGIAVRQHILEQAENQGLTQSENFKQKLEDEFNRFLVNRIYLSIKSGMDFSDDELQTFYKNNTYLFKESSMINVSEIIVDSKTTAIKINKELEKGQNFSKLAQKYSINKKTAIRGGEVGYVSPSELGPFAKKIYSLKNGEWNGPFKKGGLYFFLQKNDMSDSTLVGFEESKQVIREKLIANNIETAIKKRLKTIRQKTKILSYPEKLKTLSYYN